MSPIDDADTLRRINPQSIRMYLTSCGWENVRSEQTFDIFEFKATGDRIQVPNSRDLRDYALRVRDVVSELSVMLSESPQTILSGMMLSASTDLIEYRYESGGGEAGLIPVQDLERLLEAGRNINLYAYRDMLDFHVHYHGSRWTKAKDLDSIRVGPTVPGSYIVQFVYPAIACSGSVQSTVEGGIQLDNPNLHLLCDKIESSLGEVIDAAERGRTSLDSELRISHNFVASVAGLSFDNADVEVRRMTTLNHVGTSSKPLPLSRNVVKNILALERGMRPPECESERTFVGRLVQLIDLREKPSDEPISMKIRYIDEDDRIRTARFSISGDDADVAYDAAKNRNIVSITGVLAGPANSRQISDVTEFKILD